MKIHIIGAGPAGVSLAYYASKQGFADINLYEMSDKIGGLARSWTHKEFTLDTGPHIFHSDDLLVINDWLSTSKDLFDHGKFYSCNLHPDYDGVKFDYPVSIETLRANLPDSKCQRIFDEISSCNRSNKKEVAQTFHEFMVNKVGPSLTELFYKEYPQKLWGINTSEMLAEWAPQRIDIREKIEPFYTKKFVAVGKYGTGKIFENIVRNLVEQGKLKLFINHKLSGLEVASNKINSLNFESHKIKISKDDIVISSIPATALAYILGERLTLSFRGVRSQYLFFKNERVLPKKYNWVYISDPKVPFNRITEPPSMASLVSPSNSTYICIETTYDQFERPITSKDSYRKVLKWIRSQEDFITDNWIEDFSTFNYEDYVYPIQDRNYRGELAKYNSITSNIINLFTLGTGGEFHYSDMQIIFRKANQLISSLLTSDQFNLTTNSNFIPQISNLNLLSNSDLKTNNELTMRGSNNQSWLHKECNCLIPIIAEIGINHNGDINLAKEMITAAINSGAHIAKFQYYQTGSRLLSNQNTSYFHETADCSELSLGEVFDRSSLSLDMCKELIIFSKEIKCRILFTVFDEISALNLKRIGVKYVKTASMDCNNIKLHTYLGKLNFDCVIISTGMSDYREIDRTLACYKSSTEVLLMSCRSSYPVTIRDIDLGEIDYLKDRYSKCVGFSDHTEGLTTSMLAIASGASFLERHFTTSKEYVGPDNAMSINSKELKELSTFTELISQSMKYRRKIIHSVEQATFSLQKKSLRYPRDLNSGDVINTNELLALAPPEGYSEFHATIKIGSYRLETSVKAFEPIQDQHMTFIK